MNFDTTIARYREVRDTKRATQERHKDELAPLNAELEELEGALLNMLNESGQDSAKTSSGTAYKTVKKSATVEDGEAFLDYIRGNDQWELCDIRANSTAIGDFFDDTGEPPPGVKFSRFVEVGVRAPAKPTK